ncbi:MAG: Rrf2 family transcriptional regulator [Flavobacteriales bacterium]|nr:Rrf2 family transcriptional regulator [Flavobacteriales bacterium]
MFSKACEYGIKAAIFIAVKSEQESRVSLNEIAKEINSPIAFTAKVLQQLTKSGIVDSVKGPKGGFEIDKNKIVEIKLSKIVSAIDGDAIYKGCGLGFHNCNENKPCPVHHKFKLIRDDLKQMLETTSLLDLSNDINNGITFLKR